MRQLTASAPGKVVLSGEYAVLEGAAAISMAVDRRAAVRIRNSGAASVQCIGPADENDTRLIDAVCKALDVDRPHAALVLDTSRFADAASGLKFGIGSSAALTVALVEALLKFHGESDCGESGILRTALAAHREFQHGVGSGIDVATSVAGGLIQYRAGDAPRSLSWPVGLHFKFLWSGVVASTRAKVSRLDAAQQHASKAALGDAAERVATGWQCGDAAALLGELGNYVDALQRFDVDHDLGVFDAGHGTLSAKALSTDSVYKPCGAGGGDVGVVFGLSEEAVQQFTTDAHAAGFRSLGMEMDLQGVASSGAGT